MNKKLIVIIFSVLSVIVIAVGTFWYFQNNNKQNTNSASINLTANIPYYFIVIHNEPLPDLTAPAMPTLEESYATLKRIIAKADEYNIKLTLMFTAQWADYINSSPERKADLASWKKSGHEIAGHHHDIHHGLWDGYTNLPETEALKIRSKMGKSESYRGTLTDYMN